MPRESSKCRDWEKERRNRLNEAFTALCKVLPCYDPAVTTSKIDILRNAKSHIEELQTKIKDLISTNENDNTTKVKGDEITKLQERIKRLLGKNEQLCSLLREAKITIPAGCAIIKKFKHSMYWSNKIGPEQAKILQQKELEKENAGTKKVARKFKSKPKNGQNTTPKHRKAIVNRADNKKLKVKRRKLKQTNAKCVIVLSQPNISQNCYVITNTPANIGNKSTVITNSGLLSTPLVSSTEKTTKTISTIPNLGPGTLILANGTIMPVLPQTTVLPLAPQVIPRPQNPTVILLPKQTIQTVTKTTTSTKTLARIKPKYCLTRTTQVNKVPIPALTSKYANNDIVLNKNDVKPQRKTVEKKNVNKNDEENENLKRKREEDDKNDNETPNKKQKNSGDNEEVVPEVTETVPEKEKEENNKEKPAETVEIVENIVPEPEPQKIVEPNKKVEEPATEMKSLELNINHSELSNDIFASLQVPTGCQNPESTSPTAAFLLAFPLVSSLTGVKVAEVTEDDNVESQRETPTLLQIGTMDSTKPTQSQSDSFTPSLLNLDNLSFFSSKDFYNSLELTTTSGPTINTNVKNKNTVVSHDNKTNKNDYVENKTDLVACFENRVNHDINNYEIDKKQSEKVIEKPNCSNYIPEKSFTSVQNNYFNDANVKITTSCTYGNVIKSYPDPLYTNSNTYSYTYHSDTNFNQNYYKNITKNDTNRSYYSLNYENYSDYRKNDLSSTSYYNNTSYKDKFSNNSTIKKSVTTSKPPINWMTTPDNKMQQSEYSLTNKENDFGTTTTFNTFSNSNTNYFNSYNNDMNQEARKALDLPIVPPVNTYHQRQETVEENQFAWSPTKLPQLLDPTHNLVSATLPTLVGDLALNFNNEKTQKNRATRVKTYENQSSNFLSVSQLVDHNKESVPARTTSRRNSGNRTSVKKVQKTNQQQRKMHDGKIDKNVKNNQIYDVVHQVNDLLCDKTRNVTKNTNNYSAEALIAHQMPDLNHKTRQQNYTNANKSISVPFLTDNILPYFPPVDLQSQDNNYMQQNQNYQTTSFGHNFSSSYNNTYTPNTFIPTATTITSTYLSTNNFMHDVSNTTGHDYSDNLNLFPTNTNKDKNCNKQNIRNQQNLCATNAKKSKRKHVSSNETNLPNFVDFSFLSMPGSINSPILPDDFHTHTGFLQPPPPPATQLYPCKNPLYTKQNDLTSGSLLPLPPVPGTRSNIQHPEISPSVNTAGTSLTNFNLSTIFPEINNKSALPDSPYLEPRIKDHSSTRSYTSTAQVSFNEKPSFSFSYINSTSQSYNNQ